jgi:uncharacterized MnhB-related membrane protein
VIWLAILIVLVMLASAVAVLLMKSHIAAVAAASIVSLGVSVIFVLLHAPDVAMTEATVGAGLSSLILALGIKKLGLWKQDVSNNGDESS